jgi:hypothetical protein
MLWCVAHEQSCGYRLEEEAARKKQQQEEEERRLEQQRRQTEALRRLQEQQQRAKTAPWSQQTPGAGSSLADIQRQEKERKEVLTSYIALGLSLPFCNGPTPDFVYHF